MLACLLLCGCVGDARLSAYAGRWVVKSHGKNMMLLTLAVHHGKLFGTLVMPKHQTEEGGLGEFFGISLPIVNLPVVGKWKHNSVELTVGRKPDRNWPSMKLPDNNHAEVNWYHGQVPDWRFERVSAGQKATVATDWPPYDLDPEVVAIRQQLQSMADQDKAAREKASIDERETDELSAEARPLLERIFARYGWPKFSTFDVSACDNFSLLVQHEPSDLQEKMLPAMAGAVSAGEASKLYYAYLFDRVQIAEGKSQHWGTQASCENGHAVLSQVDDMARIDERRKEVGLGPLTESLKASDAICARVRH